MPPRFTAVLTSHANETGLAGMLGQLMYQTRPPEELIVLASETPGLGRIKRQFAGPLRDRGITTRWLTRPDLGDFGHEKRAEGMTLAKGEFVGFFNDDDRYADDYIERMLAHTDAGADVVYCAWSAFPDCGFQMGASTSGNFIFRRDLGLLAGYTERSYPADGHFINALAAKTQAIVKEPTVIYWHNDGVQRATVE